MPAEESEMARAKSSKRFRSPGLSVGTATPVDPRWIREAVGKAVAQLRASAPRVHVITNSVAQNFTANVLLAAGATPSMTIALDEVSAFTASADALLVNIGTLDANMREAIPCAIAVAKREKKPFVLDPVLVDRSPPRLAFANTILAEGPAIVRANVAELTTLAGGITNDDAVAEFAEKHECVVAATGSTDFVTDGKNFIYLGNGHLLMSKITAMGCAASALTAAFAAVESSPFIATVAALSMMNVAGEIVGKDAKGPGSFAVALLDTIHAIDSQTIYTRLEILA
jgi:hydroxyethylthiazole kinase